MLSWKGQIRDRKLITTPVTVMDVMPTILELLNDRANVTLTDGKSLLPVLFNESQQSQHEFIFHYVEITKPAAVTLGPYKVVYTDTQGTDCQLTCNCVSLMHRFCLGNANNNNNNNNNN